MLTVASAAAVVAGAPVESSGESLGVVMRVRVLRDMFVRGELVTVGDVIEVDELVAGRLIGMGKAAPAGPAGRETAAALPPAEVAVDPVTSEIPKSAPRKSAKKSAEK